MHRRVLTKQNRKDSIHPYIRRFIRNYEYRELNPEDGVGDVVCASVKIAKRGSGNDVDGRKKKKKRR